MNSTGFLASAVSHVDFVVDALNLLVYGGFAAAAMRARVRSSSRRLRTLHTMLAAVSATFAVAVVPHFIVQASHAGGVEGALVDVFLVVSFAVVAVCALVTVALVVASWRRNRLAIDLTERIMRSHLGSVAGPPRITEVDLTAREREVLAGIRAGHVSNKSLAAALFIAPATAGTHVRNILGKTGLHDRRDLLFAEVSRED